jgi:hypothetical protein
LKIAEPEIVQIQTSIHFSFNNIRAIMAVKNSGNELDIASRVAHLTDTEIFIFFQIIDSCSSNFQVAKLIENITHIRVKIIQNQFQVNINIIFSIIEYFLYIKLYVLISLP